MPKSKKTIPIYEYPEKVNGQTRYYIRPYLNGKQITKRLDDNGKMWIGRDGYNRALAEINKIENELININNEITYNQLKDFYLNKIKKENKTATYLNYLNLIENHIDPYLLNKKAIKISRNDILNWKAEIEKKNFSISYSQKAYRVLKSIFNMGRINGLNQNVVESVDNFKKVNSEVVSDKDKLRYITFDDFNNFISTVNDIMWKTFFIFLYYTGCRKGEVLALKWTDINFYTNTIEINKTLNSKIKGTFEITNTKNLQNRKIKMSVILINQLSVYKEYLLNNDIYNDNNYVFGGTNFLALTTIGRKKDYYFNLAGLKPITIHEFRHSHVSLLINEYIKKCEKLNIKIDTYKFFLVLSERMGHTIQVMQQTYMHLFPAVQDEIVDLLDQMS